MRILLDECVPTRFRNTLVGHDVQTVTYLGWSGQKNGQLLRSMLSQGFEVLLTVDRNLRYQQDLRAAGIATIVLIAETNRLEDLVPLVPATLVAL